jgi:hypothetical protein
MGRRFLSVRLAAGWGAWRRALVRLAAGFGSPGGGLSHLFLGQAFSFGAREYT